jgi:hypothetical protein
VQTVRFGKGSGGKRAKPWLAVATALLTIPTLVACGNAIASTMTTPADWRIVGGVAVWGNDVYYLATAEMNDEGAPDLWHINDSGKAHDLGTVSVPDECEYAFLGGLVGLSSGSVGAVATCADFGEDGDSGKAFYVTIDVASEPPVASVLMDLPDSLPYTQAVVWDSGSLRSGWLIYADVNDCAAIARIVNGTPGPFGPYAPTTGLDWPIDYDALHPESPDCSHRGEAGFTAADHSRDLIFLASSNAIGKSGTDRDDVGWKLFSMTPQRAVSQFPAEFVDPAGLAASPTADQIAISAKHDGVAGLWVVDTTTKAIKLIRKGDYGPPTYRPDGKDVIATDYSNGLGSLVQFSVTRSR